MRIFNITVLFIVWILGNWFLGEIMHPFWFRNTDVYWARDIYQATIVIYTSLMAFLVYRNIKWFT